MSVTLMKAVIRHSRARGETRCVLVALASHAKEKALERYGDTTAYPSRETLAREAGIPDSPKGPNVTQVSRKLRELEELGEIRWTGETMGKGAKVYEILLPTDDADAEPVTPKESRVSEEAVTPRESRVAPVQAAEPGSRDIPAGTRDNSDLSRDTQDVTQPVTPKMSRNQEGTRDIEQDLEQARADARGPSSSIPSPEETRRLLGLDRRPPDPALGVSPEWARDQLGLHRGGESLKDRNHRRAEEAEDAALAAEGRETILR